MPAVHNFTITVFLVLRQTGLGGLVSESETRLPNRKLGLLAMSRSTYIRTRSDMQLFADVEQRAVFTSLSLLRTCSAEANITGRVTAIFISLARWPYTCVNFSSQKTFQALLRNFDERSVRNLLFVANSNRVTHSVVTLIPYWL